MSDRIVTHDEAYMCTAAKNVGALARSVVQLNPVVAGTQGPVCYGAEIRVMSNPYICPKPLHLHSAPVTPMAFARFSRNQEVCMHVKPEFSTVWRIIPSSGGKAKAGQPVMASEPIFLQHVGTNQFLSTDNIPYRNDFGNEMEVSAMSAATKNKTQMLAGEYNGEKVREDVGKSVSN